jgi:tetratricopeptide (TPR) repeat protein/transcriptional regulator with XRE-family HTH domain
LSELSGINKGNLSRIEKGDIIRPEFQTVLQLTEALKIPFEIMAEYYVESEYRSDHLMPVFEEVLKQGSGVDLIRKVAEKYLESNGDSFELTDNLFQIAHSIEDNSIKLSLYDLVIDYSRLHGIMPFIAKGLFRKYMIERYDFSKLKDSYYSGRYILNYVNFLPRDQQIELYYRLGIQAFNIRLYNESITHCKGVLKYDGENHHRINAISVLRDACFKAGEFTESELYSLQYKQFNYPHTRENIILMDALFSVRKGNIGQAIEELTALLENCNHDYALSATNQLLQIYLQQGDLEKAGTIINNCRADSSLISNPSVQDEYAEFLSFQGEYYLAVGDYEKSITCMLEGALHYSKIIDTVKEKECLSRVMQIQLGHSIPSQSTFEKLNTYFTNEKEVEG